MMPPPQNGGAVPDSYDRYPSRPAFAPESIRLCPGDRTEGLWLDPKVILGRYLVILGAGFATLP